MPINISEIDQKTLKKMRPAIIILILAIIIIPIALAIHSQIYSATISVTVAPTSATILIDGNSAGTETRVTPGAHTVTLEMSGFETVEVEVEVAASETAEVMEALASNDPSTASWYDTHSEDATLAEGITGWKYDEASVSQAEKYPVAEKLPYETSIYTIGYGSDEASEFYILIEADDGAKTVALKRLSQLADLGDYEIRFIDYTNPFASHSAGLTVSAASITAAINSMFSSRASNFTINSTSEYQSSGANYYLITLAYKFTSSQVASDLYRLVLSESSGVYTLETTPALSLTYSDYENLDKEMLKTLNSVF